jgi:hypothetical protein
MANPNPVLRVKSGSWIKKDLTCELINDCLTKAALINSGGFSCEECSLANPDNLEPIYISRKY